MGQFDQTYTQHVNNILLHGTWDKDQNVRPHWADGTPAYTKSVISSGLHIDCTEVPIPTKKRLAWKTSIHELIWFYIQRTSDVSYLRDNKVKIWEEWTREDDTIGKTYGYQLGKSIPTSIRETKMSNGFETRSFHYTNQIYKLIDGLKNDPASRRHIISLWNIDDLWDMALYPCWWSNQWLVRDGALHLITQARSSDTALGLPFNVFQYYVLLRMIAQVTGYRVGSMTCNIADAHIYERHIDPLSAMSSAPDYAAPKLWLNPEIKNFDDFTIHDFELVDPGVSDKTISKWTREEASMFAYYQHGPTVTMEIAI